MPEATDLQKPDITAMRQAELVAITGDTVQGVVQMTKQPKAGSVWEGTPTRNILVPIEGNHESRIQAAFTPELSAAWQSFAHEVRAGDKLTVVVRKDYGTNGETKDAGISVDVIGLKITRETKAGKTKEFYRHLIIGAYGANSPNRVVDPPKQEG